MAAAGIRWHVQVAGTGPDLVLLHGAGGSTHEWAAVLPRLAASFRVTAPDLPGHGFTERPPAEGLGLSGMAGSVVELLAGLERRPALVVGHSAGAAVGLEIARRGGAGAWVGINPALVGAGRPDVPEAILELVRPLLRSPFAARLVAGLARNTEMVDRLLDTTGSGIPDEARETYRRLLGHASHVGSMMEMMTRWETGPLDRLLEAIEVPALVLVGTDDRWVDPGAGREVARRLPGGRLVEMPGAGHLAPEEAPIEVTAHVEAFARAVGILPDSGGDGEG